MVGWHFPGHNYLGPGTDLKRKFDAIDEDDYIAKQHDLAYSFAKSYRDIQNADKEAVFNFARHFAKTGSSHSGLASGLLGVKFIAEYVRGKQFYPGTMESGSMQSDQPPAKKMKEDTSTEVSSPNAIQNNPLQICRSSEALAFGKSVIFKKSWTITTWSFQSPIMKKDTAFYLCTPLACVPVNNLALYMSPVEFSQLPLGSVAESSFVKITSRGYRCPFETDTTTSSGANNIQPIFGYSATGLNHKYNLIYTKYVSSPKDPTQVTSLKLDGSQWDYFFYGSKPDDLPSCLPWIHKRFEHYAAVPLGTDITVSVKPTIMNDVNCFSLNETSGIPVINYEYQFDVAPLKIKFPAPISNEYLETMCSTKVPIFMAKVYSGNEYKIKDKVLSMRGMSDTSKPEYHDEIEKHDFLSFAGKPSHNTLAQPDCFIGCSPTISSNPFVATPTFQPVMAYWQIDSTLVVNFNFNSSFVNKSVYSAKKTIRSVKDMSTDYVHANNLYGYIDGERVNVKVDQ